MAPTIVHTHTDGAQHTNFTTPVKSPLSSQSAMGHFLREETEGNKKRPSLRGPERLSRRALKMSPLEKTILLVPGSRGRNLMRFAKNFTPITVAGPLRSFTGFPYTGLKQCVNYFVVRNNLSEKIIHLKPQKITRKATQNFKSLKSPLMGSPLNVYGINRISRLKRF
jgi:hypothetical protein